MVSSLILSSVLVLTSSTLAAGGPSSLQCAQASVLASGIDTNLAVQAQELATAKELADQLSGNVDKGKYEDTKKALLGFIHAGMSQREWNQANAPEGNAAIPGLDFVAGAQQTELGLALKLNGDPNNDKDIVQNLIKDFTDGTGKNKDNKTAVS